MRKIVAICFVFILNFSLFSKEVKYIYDIDKVKEVFKSDGIIINTNGIQLNGYDWGISLLDIRDESINEQRRMAIVIRMKQDGYNLISENNNILEFENEKFVQTVAVEKIVVIAYNKKNSDEKIIKQLRKLLTTKF